MGVGSEFLDECNDREAVALDAFCLEPVIASTRSVAAIPPLAHNPFEPHATGMLEHGFGIPLEMLAIPRPSDVYFDGELAQQAFAFDKRRAAKVATVEIKKVEDVIDEPVHPVPSQIGIQRFEIRDPLLVWDNHLAVQDRRLRRKPGKRFCQGPKTLRLIIATARE